MFNKIQIKRPSHIADEEMIRNIDKEFKEYQDFSMENYSRINVYPSVTLSNDSIGSDMPMGDVKNVRLEDDNEWYCDLYLVNADYEAMLKEKLPGSGLELSLKMKLMANFDNKQIKFMNLIM